MWGRLGPHKAVRMLQIAALLRNICQGIAVVDVSLYLKSLGWNGAAIGGLLALSGIVRSLFTVFAGEINQRLGPKRFVMLFEVIAAAAALMMTLSANPIVICLAVSTAGFGRGHSGSGGPITPIERGWLGAYALRRDKSFANYVFGIHAALGYLGMGVGSAAAAFPSLCQGILPGALAYRPLFALMSGLALACTLVIANAPGGSRKPSRQAARTSPDGHEQSVRNHQTDTQAVWAALCFIMLMTALVTVTTAEWNHWFPNAARIRPLVPLTVVIVIFCAKLVVDKIRHSKHEARRRVAHASVTLAQTSAPGRTQALAQLANVMNGAAVALASTMTSYWFSVRFDAPEALIGLVVSASYIATGMVAMATVRLADRFGPVQVMVYMQLCGILFVLALPWAPWFWLAAVLNIGCMALNLGSRGSRSAIAAAGTRGQRSWQRKVSMMIVLSLTTGAWPSAFGRMLEEGEYVLPFCVAASAQLFSTLWFRAVYRRTPNS
ncbi:MFS transporter [Alicyclobacillus kakegawensis]|uniref:MFS transporter n=1 Tax=Alicyclobacillus kakegawensis TaxID=392012 RepID=UPI0034E2A897